MESTEGNSNGHYYFNINSLYNLYKNNNELLASIYSNNSNTNSLSEENINQIITHTLNINNRIYDNIINLMDINNYSRSNNSYSRNRNSYRDISRLLTPISRPTGYRIDERNNERNRNILFRNNRVYIDNVPYIIDNVERYSIENFNSLSDFFNPIEIFPTQSQIENATRIARYSDIVRPLNTSCPISLERFNDNDRVTMIRYCGHIFNTEQLNSWFRSNCRCPVCRYDIRNYNSSDNVNNVFNQVNESNENTNNINVDNTNVNNINNTNTNVSNNNNVTNQLNDGNFNEDNQNNIINSNSSNRSVERNINQTSNLNSNIMRQMISNILSELDSNLLNNNEQERLGNLFFDTYIDLSGNNTLNTFSQIWNIYRNNQNL